MRDPRYNIIAATVCIVLIIMMLTIIASADPRINTSARAATLYEPTTKAFLYSKNADEKLKMASTTKIMTALVAIERLELDEVITVPKECVGIEGSSIYLEEGDTLTVRDLLYSLLLQSANDAAAVLATRVSGDIFNFSALMNKRAGELGLYSTSFENPHGLDSDEHYTTAHDMAILAAAALENDVFCRIVSTYKYTFHLSDKLRCLVNHNKLLKMYDGCVGIKTGYTKQSGRCLVTAAKRDGLTMIAVTLDAPLDWEDHKTLFNEGFKTLERVDLGRFCKQSFTVPVINSQTESISAMPYGLDSINLVVPRGSANIKADIDIKPYAPAPVRIGDKLGEIVFYNNELECARVDILSRENAEEVINKRFNILDFLSP